MTETSRTDCAALDASRLDLLRQSALELGKRIRSGDLSSEDLTRACLERIEEVNPRLNAFVLIDAEGALATAREVDAEVAQGRGEDLHPLAGVPIAVKDNMVVRGQDTTCCSRILKGWKPPYDATVVTKLREARLPMIGRTNMDEFAMGSSTEHSCYGPTRNPWDDTRIPGGSGGGSATAVGAYMVPLALGSDTGGSIRQPAAVTGTVGAKPTYGYVSRYGLVAMASSLDQIGPVTRSVDDAAALQQLIGGHDPLDSTSIKRQSDDLIAAIERAQSDGVGSLRFGMIKELMGEGFDSGVVEVYRDTVERIRNAGATIVEVSCPTLKYALAAYYLIMPAEVSSNLARFDGVRFGIRELPEGEHVTAESMMAATRGVGFGDEVKRRIILGTFVLSSGYYDAYYGNALKVRSRVEQDMNKAFEQCDILISPTSPTTAFEIGSRLDDPMTMYMCDLATLPANLCGLPAISLPVGCAKEDGLPVGFQIIAPHLHDELMYRAAQGVMNLIDDNIALRCPVDGSAGDGSAGHSATRQARRVDSPAAEARAGKSRAGDKAAECNSPTPTSTTTIEQEK